MKAIRLNYSRLLQNGALFGLVLLCLYLSWRPDYTQLEIGNNEGTISIEEHIYTLNPLVRNHPPHSAILMVISLIW